MRTNFQDGFLGDVANAPQVSETRYEPLVLHSEGNPEGVLFESRGVAVNLKAPDRISAGEPEIVKRDAQFGGPSEFGYPRPRFKHSVPGVGLPVVVIVHPVDHHASGRDEERIGGLAIAVGVEGQVNPVGLLEDPLVATAQAGGDFIWFRIETFHSDIERLVVVEETDLGALRRGDALVWKALGEGVDERSGLPDRLVEVAVATDGAVGPNRFGGGDGIERGSGQRHCCEEGDQESGNQWSASFVKVFHPSKRAAMNSVNPCHSLTLRRSNAKKAESPITCVGACRLSASRLSRNG